MRLSNKSKLLTNIIKKLQERPKTTSVFYSSIFNGITVGEYINLLDKDTYDTVTIKVNKVNYDPSLHDYLLIEQGGVTIKETLVKKEFKEKIVIQVNQLEDILRISEESKNFRSTYGYVIKLSITIKTKE